MGRIPAPHASPKAPENREWEWHAPQESRKTDAILESGGLFRFSALTANTHRIHYDAPYVRAEEGYPGLVVHGPLLAVLMLELVRRNASQRVRSLSFRFRSPVGRPQRRGVHPPRTRAGPRGLTPREALAQAGQHLLGEQLQVAPGLRVEGHVPVWGVGAQPGKLA